MKCILIVTLLLFGINTGWCHSIARLETTRNEVDDTLSQEIYEVKDSPSSLKFVYPKKDPQALREIIYYHVIERPYGGKPVVHPEGPDFDETVRPFTNSHGYQFLDPELDKDSDVYEESQENTDKDEDAKSSTDNKDIVVDPQTEGSVTTEPEYEIVYIVETDDDTEVATTMETNIYDAAVNDTATELYIDGHTEKTYQPEMEIEEVRSTTEETLDDKAKHTRKLLFDLVKEKYYNRNTEQNDTSIVAQKRRKRDVDWIIPEAPRLGELDLESLPPYIRPMINIGRNQFEEGSLDQDAGLEEIKNKMRGLFDSLGEEQGSAGLGPKTYGMELSGDHGHVWNDMWTDPGVSFDIEPPTAKPEEEPIAEEKPHEEITPSEDIEEKHENNDDDIEISIKRNQTHHTRYPIAKNLEDSTEENQDGENIPDLEENRLRKRKPNRKEKEEDIMKDLIENDQFWKWLADWTSVYMDELSQHINKQIKEEVKKQMELIAESHKDIDKKEEILDKNLDDKEHKGGAGEDLNDKTNNAQKEPVITEDKDKTTVFEKEETLNEKEDKSVPEIKDGKLHIDGKEIPIVHDLPDNVESIEDAEKLKMRKDKDEKDKINTENKENIIIDSNNTNDKSPLPSSVSAKTMIGNSIGNDKVTNIFIFYPNKETDIKNEIKPDDSTHLSETKAEIDDKITSTTASILEDSSTVAYTTTHEVINQDLETTTIPADALNPSTEAQAIDILDKTNDNDVSTTENAVEKTTEPIVELDISTQDKTTENVSTTENILEVSTESKLEGNMSNDELEVTPETKLIEATTVPTIDNTRDEIETDESSVSVKDNENSGIEKEKVVETSPEKSDSTKDGEKTEDTESTAAENKS